MRIVDEKREFQQHLLQHLRMTELGGEVREAETVGGGILDLRYRNVVIEREVPDVESTDWQQFPLEVPGFRESRKFLEAWSFIVFPDAPKTISGRENDLKNPKDLRIHKVENVYFSIG